MSASVAGVRGGGGGGGVSVCKSPRSAVLSETVKHISRVERMNAGLGPQGHM